MRGRAFDLRLQPLWHSEGESWAGLWVCERGGKVRTSCCQRRRGRFHKFDTLGVRKACCVKNARAPLR